MPVYPDLTAAKAILEKVLFGDPNGDAAATVRITLDPQGPLDDTFNVNTGLWTRVGQDTVYEGRAAFRAANPETDVNVGVPVLRSEWILKLPMSAPVPTSGSMVEILTCARDPAIVGRRFRVERLMGTSFALLRRVIMHEYTIGPKELP